jgi:hypothetical protein
VPGTPISATPTIGSDFDGTYTTALTYTTYLGPNNDNNGHWLAHAPTPGNTATFAAARIVIISSTLPRLAFATPDSVPATTEAVTSQPGASSLDGVPLASEHLLKADWLEVDDHGRGLKSGRRQRRPRSASTIPYGLTSVTPGPVPVTTEAATSQPGASSLDGVPLAAEHSLEADWLEVDDRDYEYGHWPLFTLGPRIYLFIAAILSVSSIGVGAYKVFYFEHLVEPTEQLVDTIDTSTGAFEASVVEPGGYSVDADSWHTAASNQTEISVDHGPDISCSFHPSEGASSPLGFRYVCVCCEERA